MFKILCQMLLVLACLSANRLCAEPTTETPGWQNALQTVQAKTDAKAYDELINEILSPEYKKSAAQKHGESTWRDVFLQKELRNLEFCLSAMNDPKITPKDHTVRLCGQYDCYLVFIQIDGRYYLHEFGQKLTSM